MEMNAKIAMKIKSQKNYTKFFKFQMGTIGNPDGAHWNWVLAFAVFALTVLALAPSAAQAGTFSQTVNYLSLNQGLVGWWTFDGPDMYSNVRDRSGQGNHGSLVGIATTSITAGKLGQAYFNKRTGNVRIPNAPSLVITGDLTISMWIKPRRFGDQPTHYVDYLLEKGYGDNDNYSFYLSYGRLAFEFKDTGGTYRSYIESTNRTKRDAWQLVSVVYSDSQNNIAFYRDGEQVYTTTASYSLSDQNYDLFIGKQNYTEQFAYRFDGGIDDVRIYNRALSATEVRALYNAGTAKTNATPRISSDNSLLNGLVAHYTFDGPDLHQNVVDRSGQGNHGRIVSATATSTAPGAIGQAYHFNPKYVTSGFDTSDYIVVPDNSSLRLQNVTVSAWVWFDQRYRSWWYVVEKGGTDTYDNYTLHFNSSGQIGFEYNRDGSGGSVSQYSNAVGVGASWGHAVVTFDDPSNTLNFYWNGALNKTTTVTDSILSTSTQDLYIGRQNNTSSNANRWNGRVDDVRIYNRALSAAEVRSLYNLGASKVGVTPPAVPNRGLSSGLIGHYTFDGMDVNWASGTVSDRSGSGNTGYVVNMSTSTAPTPGKLGQALLFDGADDVVTIPNAASLDTLEGSNVATISFWVKRINGYGTYLSRNSGTTGRLFEIYNDSFFAIRQIWRYGGSSIGGSSLEINCSIVGCPVRWGEWAHVVAVYDNPTGLLYVDGALKTFLDGSGGALNDTISTPISIGTNHNAIIDDVRIYNRALSANEIKQLYEMGR